MKRNALISALLAAVVAVLVVPSATLAEGIPKQKPHQTTSQQLKSLRKQVTRLLNLVSAQQGRLTGDEQTLAGLAKGTTPVGLASGVLSGNYPSPTFAANSITRDVFRAGAVGPVQLSGNLAAVQGNAVAVPSGTTQVATVTCPAGARLLSGGPEWGSATANGTAIISSSPTFSGDTNRTWVVQGRIDSGAPGNQLFAEALCLGA